MWPSTSSGLALALAKHIPEADQAVREGRWHVRHELVSRELNGKILGVLGLGRIGLQTARLCRMGLDMKILYFDVRNFPEAEKSLGAQRVGIQELFSEADLVAVHLPLVAQTHHLVDRNLLKLMKPTAYIVNLARGPIWKEEDLVEALQQGWIAGAASDVFEQEPLPPEHPLLGAPNFLATPHSAAHTEESLIRMSLVAATYFGFWRGNPRNFQCQRRLTCSTGEVPMSMDKKFSSSEASGAFPEMYMVEQRFQVPVLRDVEAAVKEELLRFPVTSLTSPGQTVAVAVGSRGDSRSGAGGKNRCRPPQGVGA